MPMTCKTDINGSWWGAATWKYLGRGLGIQSYPLKSGLRLNFKIWSKEVPSLVWIASLELVLGQKHHENNRMASQCESHKLHISANWAEAFLMLCPFIVCNHPSSSQHGIFSGGGCCWWLFFCFWTASPSGEFIDLFCYVNNLVNYSVLRNNI